MATATKTKKPQSLGKGLSALLSQEVSPYNKLENIDKPQGGGQTLLLTQLQPGVYQPRMHFREEELDELAQSIRQHGILQPLLVRKLEKKDQFEIIAGERRWQAAKIAGLKEVPVLIQDLTDAQALEIGLVENVQRQDLTPIEEAQGYQRLMDEFKYSKEGLSKIVGRSLSHVTNTLRLLSLPEEVRELVENKQLSAGHARALITIPNQALPLAQRIVEQGLNVRQVEELVKEHKEKPAVVKAAPRKMKTHWAEQLQPLEENFARLTGLPTTIRPVGSGGKITMTFSGKHDLEMLLLKFQDKK